MKIGKTDTERRSDYQIRIKNAGEHNAVNKYALLPVKVDGAFVWLEGYWEWEEKDYNFWGNPIQLRTHRSLTKP